MTSTLATHGKTTNMSLIEFLFVDKRRLDSYFEQIEAPVAYDKVPVWTAELGFPTGARAMGSQNRHARQWTTYEKLKAVIKYLKENKLLESERERRKTDKATEFRFEICEARKAFIPPDNSRFAGFKGLNIWIAPSLGQPRAGMLFLIEDFQDVDMPVYTQPSGYSALLTLVAELRESLKQTIVGNLIEEKFAISQERALAESEFAIDPIGFLTNLGARISDMRKIQTLYRMRANLLDCTQSPCSSDELSQVRDADWDTRQGVTTVGYPIFIASGNVPAVV